MEKGQAGDSALGELRTMFFPWKDKGEVLILGCDISNWTMSNTVDQKMHLAKGKPQ